MNYHLHSKLIIVVFLVFTLMFTSGLSQAENEDNGFISIADSKTVTYSYTGFTYNDEMLMVDANALSTDIAKASVALATAAYDSNGNAVRSMLGTMGYACSSDSS